MIPDDEGLPNTAILLCAPVCLRVQVQGGLGHEVLVQGGEIRKYDFCADDLSGGRSHLGGSELPLPEASPAGGGEAALQPIIALAARQPKEQGRIAAEGDGRLNIAALSGSYQEAVAAAAKGCPALQSRVLLAQGDHAAFSELFVRAAALNNIADLPSTGEILRSRSCCDKEECQQGCK